MKPMPASRRVLLGIGLCILALATGGAVRIVQDTCGPFTDVTPGFCPFVLELYYLGITVGTSATTFSPDDPLTRGQAAVFVSKGLNQSLARSSRRAALGQWWTTTPHWDLGLGITQVDNDPEGLAADGQDIWVANEPSWTVSRVRASDGKLIGTWTSARGASAVLVAMGRIFVSGLDSPSGWLYMIDPTLDPGPVMTAASGLPPSPVSLAFDGSRIWTANLEGSVSIITPAPTLPWPVTTVTAGFQRPVGTVFDGSNVWVTDVAAGTLLKLDSAGSILQTVNLGQVAFMIFDGANIWVPLNGSDSVAVVQASTGAVLATLTGNGLFGPSAVAFDGQRILVVNHGHVRPDPQSVSLFRAADLSSLGSVPTPGVGIFGACSDGVNFWLTDESAPGKLARF
jgi:hypothetical protein